MKRGIGDEREGKRGRGEERKRGRKEKWKK